MRRNAKPSAEQAKEAKVKSGDGWKYNRKDMEMVLLQTCPKLVYHAYRRMKCRG